MPEASPMVFISYSRTDSTFVDRLEATLQSNGFRTWVDRNEVKGGQDWLNQIQDALDQCQGIGAQPGTQTQRCSTCQGTGEVRRVQQSILGQFVNVQVCESCHGKGKIPTKPCKTCLGQGGKRNMHRLVVTIPAGLDNGTSVRLTGQGDASLTGGAPGDLYIALTVTPSYP